MNEPGLALELIHTPAQAKRTAPPILFIHGGFHGAWCWADHFMPWFSGHGFDCYAVSYRDHGESERTGRHGEWRLKDYVDDVRWAAAQLPEKPILVGHSLGGSIAQKLAKEGGYPALILLAPSPIGGSNRAALRMLFTFPGPMFRGLIKGDLTAALPAFLSFFLSADLPEAERDRIAARCSGLSSLKAANDAFYLDCPKPEVSASPFSSLQARKIGRSRDTRMQGSQMPMTESISSSPPRTTSCATRIGKAPRTKSLIGSGRSLADD
ncbi:MAG: alpha/beta fold hydrolase [Azonexus sp.]|nr:alpha/beta fold hydrolase [Erythrobacter sp.]MDZ4273836.1 alpha/beta fold hydrolase [Erythrobacter sp.]MDZ4315227.1 alpha/beta fold hydrolase [Azonexus sp.]